MIDFSKQQKIYFVGIKGVAMSGLAVICHQRGMIVAGSDVAEHFITDEILDKQDIKIYQNFSVNNISDFQPDVAVVGASWGQENPEVLFLKENNIPTISDAQLRGVLSKEKRTIAVCGVHGKTTTTALVSHVFSVAEKQPSFLIGTGLVPDLSGNAAWQTGEHFVVEGDEYIQSREDRIAKFLALTPAVSIITSIEWEHVDVFSSEKELEDAFAKLISNTSDFIVACADWPAIRRILQAAEVPVVTYGLSDEAQWRVMNILYQSGGMTFTLFNSSTNFEETFETKLLGEHNALNITSAILVALHEGIKLKDIKQAVASFSGTARRLTVTEYQGVTYIDDYAHHHTAIRTTLRALRQKYNQREIWCVFQPHMASRTKAFIDELAQSFNDVDKVMFVDIFKSARENIDNISSKELVEKAKGYHKNALFTGSLDDTYNLLKKELTPGIILVTMGAGDVYTIIDKLTKE
jgi:UDP-N-acetylmuramate--alanine ligase